MRTYRELFAVREFTALFLTRCLAIGSMSLASLALGTVTYQATGSAVLTGLSLFGGPLISLIGSATVLGASDSIRPMTAYLLVALTGLVAHSLQAIPGMPWQLRFVILAFPYLIGSVTGGTTPRLLAAILGTDGFILGRSTLNAAVGLFQIVGFGAGGLLLVALSPGELFLIAAVTDVVLLVAVIIGIRDRPALVERAGAREVVRRTRSINRELLTSPRTGPVYLTMWIPSGLIVGCEALFVPYSTHAGFLFAVTAAGMLLGDITVGRFLSPAVRDRAIGPLRLLLSVPYLLLFLDPPLGVVLAVGFCSAIGYTASLPLQDRLLHLTGEERRGQVFGLAMNGLMIGQAAGAILAGLLVVWLPVHTTMGVLAVASTVVTLALSRGLSRSAGVGLRPEERTPAR